MKTYQKISFIFAILTGIFIFFMSSITFESCGSGNTNLLSIVYHLGAFFLFGFFLFLSSGFDDLKINFIIFISCFVYASLDELHQFFVPGRFCCFFDVFIDCVGVILSFVFIWFIKKCLNE